MDKNVRLLWARLRNRLSVAGSFPVVTLAWDCAGKKRASHETLCV